MPKRTKFLSHVILMRKHELENSLITTFLLRCRKGTKISRLCTFHASTYNQMHCQTQASHHVTTKSLSRSSQRIIKQTQILNFSSLHHRVFGRLHLLLCSFLPEQSDEDPFAYFQVGEDITRCNYRDPNGPANLLAIHKFCELVDLQILRNPHRSTAICISEEPGSRCQAAFLLGAYMIMRHELFPEEAMERLAPVVDAESASLPYLETDVEGESLPLRDCLRALHRCRGRGWIRFADGGDDGFDPEEYAYFDNPLNADLHELVPGRLLVSSCPRSLPGGAAWADRYDAAGRFLARDFSPAYAADHLAQFEAAPLRPGRRAPTPSPARASASWISTAKRMWPPRRRVPSSAF